MGPLALMAKAAGFDGSGSDLSRGAIYDELVEAGIDVFIGEQDGKFLAEKIKDGIDWFSYTSALPNSHPELLMAKEAGIKVTKRDDLTAFLVEKLGLKMLTEKEQLVAKIRLENADIPLSQISDILLVPFSGKLSRHRVFIKCHASVLLSPWTAPVKSLIA